MPGIDFAIVRASISIVEVLDLLAYQAMYRRADRLRGCCPLQCSGDPRIFEVYVDTNRFYCHHCGRGGNQLDLWSATQQLTIHEAARDLCHRRGIPVPYIYRW